MSIKSLSQQAIREISNSTSLSQTELDSVSKIIEDKLISAIKESVQNCSNKAVHCCGPESDIAHKISEELSNAQKALITNLTAMR